MRTLTYPLAALLVAAGLAMLSSLGCGWRDSRANAESALSSDASQSVESSQKDAVSMVSGTPLLASLQSAWVRDRSAAVVDIWGFTAEGEDWIERYDLRQMVGEPGWFGSYGFKSWAGVGQAIPRSVMHELSHSYWGAFPQVDGVDLDWEIGSDGTSEGIRRFRQDLHTFMTQPVDRYEPLRDRFRNMPNLVNGGYPDLYHFGEAEMVYFTGGNIGLMPPILRKYFREFLAPQGVGPNHGSPLNDWGDAIGWFMNLDMDGAVAGASDRFIAEEVFGLQHFPLWAYQPIRHSYARRAVGSPELLGVPGSLRAVFEGEERRRLIDFAGQFQLIKENHGDSSEFNFWRSYLSQMLDLHGRYPRMLRSLGQDARDIATALDGYVEIQSWSPEEQTGWFERNSGLPFVSDFAVLLKPRAIMSIFSREETVGGSQAGLGFKARSIGEIVERVDSVIGIAEESGAVVAAEALGRFFLDLEDARLSSDIGLILELLRGAGSETVEDMLSNLPRGSYERLFLVSPHALAAPEIPADKALEAIGIDDAFQEGEFERGMVRYAESSSGNFALDIKFESEIYRMLEELSREDVGRSFGAIGGSGLRLTPWLRSEYAVPMIRRSISHAAGLIAHVGGPRETPSRLVRTLIGVDPRLAAAVAQEIIVSHNSRFGEEIVGDIAYDSYWRSKGALIAPNASRTGMFLDALIDSFGVEWFQRQVRGAIRQAGEREGRGETEAGFRENLSLSLNEAGVRCGDGAPLSAEIVYLCTMPPTRQPTHMENSYEYCSSYR